MTGLLVMLATVAAASAVGLVLRRRDGRIRPKTAETPAAAATPATSATADSRAALTTATGSEQPDSNGLPPPVARALDDGGTGAAVTLVQLSTTFCAPCRHTRALLQHVARETADLRHVDLDITQRSEVAADLGVLRTPTTIAYTQAGRELLRFSGMPKKAALLAALEPYRVPQAEHGSRNQGA